MPKWSTTAAVNDPARYRYGFNGKEDDDEWNKQDYGARIYDPRVGRWLSVDPLVGKYPAHTPFTFVNNNPINTIDPDGKDIYILFYTVGNKRGDEMFHAAALTRQKDIEKDPNFNPNKDKVIVMGITDMATISKKSKLYCSH